MALGSRLVLKPGIALRKRPIYWGRTSDWLAGQLVAENKLRRCWRQVLPPDSGYLSSLA